jgi:very-short-patch-repair endonuclease
MDVEQIVKKHGGSARWHELRRHLTQRELDAALAENRIQRVGRGVYMLPRLYGPAVANRFGGVVSHYSAADQHRFGTFDSPTNLDVTVDPKSSRVKAPKRVRLHFQPLADDEIEKLNVTTPLRTVVDCARTYDLPVSLPIAEDAIRKRKVDRGELETAIAAIRGPGRARARAVVDAIDTRAQSPLESRLRGLLIHAGIYCFEPQFAVVVNDVKYHADLGDPVTKTLLEADSFTWHGDREAFAKDCRRYNGFVVNGYAVLRFAYGHVINEPDWVVDTVGRALEQRQL